MGPMGRVVLRLPASKSDRRSTRMEVYGQSHTQLGDMFGVEMLCGGGSN